MIEIKNLIKKFDQLEAVNIDKLKIEDNKIFGLIGQNGSGKSTLIRLLSGVYTPNDGQILINNIPLTNPESRKKLIYIPDSPLIKGETIESIYNYYATFYNLDKAKFEKYLTLFSLPKAGSLAKFSKGMARRVYLSLALASQVDILLLDESFDGIDSEGKEIFKQELIKLYEDHPLITIITSHAIRELEDIIDEFVIMKKGKIIASSLDKADKEYFNIEVGFNKETDFKQFINQDITLVKSSSRLGNFISTLSQEKLEEYFNKFNPQFLEITPLSLENYFIYVSKEANNND